MKRGFFEFSSTLHGGVDLRGREVRAPATAEVGIEHRSFRDLQHWIEKFNRYTSTEALQLANRGIIYDWRGALRFMVHDLWEHYEKFDARLDGERGWILTWCAALYRWTSVAKLIDLGRSSERMGGPSSLPADLDEFVDALQEELAYFRAEQPMLPLGVVVRAPIWGSSPAALESRKWIGELAECNRALVVEDLPCEASANVTRTERLLLQALERGRRARSVMTITFWCPFIVPADRCACHNVLRLNAEANIAPQYLAPIAVYDELWVESLSQANSLRKAGAAPERIRIVSSTNDGLRIRDDSKLKADSAIASLFEALEQSLEPQTLTAPNSDQIRLVLEGEFFAGHSFSNINEHLARRFARDPSLALSLQRVHRQHGPDPRCKELRDLAPYFGRSLGGPADITIRHAFPPNWNAPASGFWVHIQPWEFGSLPNDWIYALRHRVDEIWVMSRYVERVYVDSGVDPRKIHCIPWGVDPETYRPDIPARDLPTPKNFRFLYVGGTVLRKGFDRVLEAYLQEFSPQDDVCLVIKDVGASTFYQPQSMQAQILEAQQVTSNPQILYFEEDISAGQLASLYVTCHCLVAPYRGEGFGLPVLEALACGLAPIVPRGGPTDDFVTDEFGYRLPSTCVSAERVTNLCGPATELHVSIEDLRATMRQAFENKRDTQNRGQCGSRHVRTQHTWDRTASRVIERLHALTGRDRSGASKIGSQNYSAAVNSDTNQLRLGLAIGQVTDSRSLIESLARMRPYVDSAYVLDSDYNQTASKLAHEYNATEVPLGSQEQAHVDWLILIRAGEYLVEECLIGLRSWLSSLPDSVDEITLPSAQAEAIDRQGSHSSRITRVRQPVLLKDVCNRPPPDLEEKRIGRRINAEFSLSRLDSAESTLSRTASTYGRLRKSLLIQMASGPHLELLEMTRDHHRRYANQHGMDYWDVSGCQFTISAPDGARFH